MQRGFGGQYITQRIIFGTEKLAEKLGLALPASKQIFSFTKRRKLGADIFFDKVASPYFDENVSHSMSSSEYMLVIIIL